MGTLDTMTEVPLNVLMMESSERDALVILQELKHSGYVSHCERVDTIDS